MMTTWANQGPKRSQSTQFRCELCVVFSRVPDGSMRSPREDHMFANPRSSGSVIASHSKRRFAALEQISFHGGRHRGQPVEEVEISAHLMHAQAGLGVTGGNT